jgi:hypothetical protein
MRDEGADWLPRAPSSCWHHCALGGVPPVRSSCERVRPSRDVIPMTLSCLYCAHHQPLPLA